MVGGSEKGGAHVEQVSTLVGWRTDLPAEIKITSYQGEIRIAHTTEG